MKGAVKLKEESYGVPTAREEFGFGGCWCGTSSVKLYKKRVEICLTAIMAVELLTVFIVLVCVQILRPSEPFSKPFIQRLWGFQEENSSHCYLKVVR